MSKLIDYLKNNSQGQFSTIKNGKPVMRPFQFVMERDNKFYFMTANTKSVYRDLAANNVAGFSVLGRDMKWIRLSGEVTFVRDINLKEELLTLNPMFRGVYKTAENPIYEVFYLHNGTASFHSGNGDVIEEFEI